MVKGKVVKLPIQNLNQFKLPNIGWCGIKPNTVKWEKTILNEINFNSEMYFVHSFFSRISDQNEILSVTDYSEFSFCSSFKKGNIYGCQFHPEKVL